MTSEQVKEAAMIAYDAYNEAVGGVAWNGDKLPPADEFFADEKKTTQSNGWIVAASAVINYAKSKQS